MDALDTADTEIRRLLAELKESQESEILALRNNERMRAVVDAARVDLLEFGHKNFRTAKALANLDEKP